LLPELFRFIINFRRRRNGHYKLSKDLFPAAAALICCLV